MQKTCSKCFKLLDINMFGKAKKCSDGIRPSCKNCVNASNKTRYNKNKKYYSDLGKVSREKNKSKIQIRRKKNKSSRNKYLRLWKINNPEKWKKLLQRRIEKVRTTPNLRILKNLRCRITQAISISKKQGRTIELLGCSIDELKDHLQSQFKDGMCWKNYGIWRYGESMKWHIDHIIPCASFNLEIEGEQKKCFNYKNLQPLWAIDNIIKGDSIESISS